MSKTQKPKPLMSNRNEAFAEATRTRHAASARQMRLRNKYNRRDQSWRKEQ